MYWASDLPVLATPIFPWSSDAGSVEFVTQGVEGDLVGDEGSLLGAADLFNHGGDGFDGGWGRDFSR